MIQFVLIKQQQSIVQGTQLPTVLWSLEEYSDAPAEQGFGSGTLKNPATTYKKKHKSRTKLKHEQDTLLKRKQRIFRLHKIDMMNFNGHRSWDMVKSFGTNCQDFIHHPTQIFIQTDTVEKNSKLRNTDRK